MDKRRGVSAAAPAPPNICLAVTHLLKPGTGAAPTRAMLDRISKTKASTRRPPTPRTATEQCAATSCSTRSRPAPWPTTRSRPSGGLGRARSAPSIPALSVRSHLAPTDLARLAADGARPAGPPPLPPPEPGSAVEVERVASSIGHISLGGQQLLAAEALAGRALGIRVEQHTLTYFDPVTRELLRTRPNPLTWAQIQRLRGARRAGPPPVPATSPVTVQRRASNSGVIMVVGQKIAPGRIHARKLVSVRISPATITIEIGADDIRTVRRTTDQPVRALRAQRSRKTAKVS